MKEPKTKKFKSFSQFSLKEKMGVPTGIMAIASDAAQFVSETIMDNGIQDDHQTNKVYTEKNPNVEFPVGKIGFMISHEVSSNLRRDVISEGSFVGNSLKIVNDKLNFAIEVDNHISSNFLMKTSVKGNMSEAKEVLKKELESLLLHEFLHVYEEYNRTKVNKLNQMFRSKEFLYASSAGNLMEANPTLHPLINQLIFLIYASVTHENRARIAQTYAFIKGIESTEEGKKERKREEIIKTTVAWDIAKTMKDWKAEEYYQEMKNIVSEQEIEKLVSDIQNFFENVSVSRTFFMVQSIDEVLPTDTEKRSAVERAEKNLSMLSKRMKAMEFYKYWEKKFNAEGAKSLRKLSRLVSI